MGSEQTPMQGLIIGRTKYDNFAKVQPRGLG